MSRELGTSRQRHIIQQECQRACSCCYSFSHRHEITVTFLARGMYLTQSSSMLDIIEMCCEHPSQMLGAEHHHGTDNLATVSLYHAVKACLVPAGELPLQTRTQCICKPSS